MADFATLSLLKDLLDGWEEGAVALEAYGHRRNEPSVGPGRTQAAQLRMCIEETCARFPELKAWHREGVVPAVGIEAPDVPEEKLPPREFPPRTA